jgi:heme/copper-type cytochrome/quinol oxidase subunit 3
MQSPTGQRFLTASLGAAPAADAAPQIVGAPFNRILWSVQAGIVLAAAGLGLWFAKNGVLEEVAQMLQVISTLAIALGLGFIVSAFASYAMSRQLGLVQPHVPHA